MKSLYNWVSLLFVTLSISSCARLHHVTLSNIDSKKMGRKFSIYVSELGLNVGESTSAMSRSSGDGNFKKIGNIISMFQVGPKTGNPVYNTSEYLAVTGAIKKKCPSLKITGLTSIREMRNYNFVSGEIVKITGYCRS